MKSAFDANVPKRKPRTRLATMLAEAEDAVARESSANGATGEDPGLFDAVATQARAAPAQARAAPAQARAAPETDAAPKPSPEAATPAEVPAPAEPPPARTARRSTAKSGRRRTKRAPPKAAPDPSPAPPAARTDLHPTPAQARNPATNTDDFDARTRLSELRKRLATASRLTAAAPEPAATAGRVKETVDGLRARLDAVHAERRELLEAVEEARRQKATAEALQREETARREAAEAQADEHKTVANAALRESEALVEERDQALRRIKELTDIENEQAGLLEELEALLTQRAEDFARLERDLQDVRNAFETTTADLDLTRAELDRAEAARARAERRQKELEADLERSQNARAALMEIQRLVDQV